MFRVSSVGFRVSHIPYPISCISHLTTYLSFLLLSISIYPIVKIIIVCKVYLINMRYIIYPEIHQPLKSPMPKLKNRLYFAAILLAAVLIFNIAGYYYIHAKSKEDKQIEASFAILTDLQGQLQ